jgi:hypothetical protein
MDENAISQCGFDAKPRTVVQADDLAWGDEDRGGRAIAESDHDGAALRSTRVSAGILPLPAALFLVFLLCALSVSAGNSMPIGNSFAG